jgi:glutathione S-transferase
VAGPSAKLYALELSHPSQAVRRMLEHKGVEHEVVNLLPGMHPVQLRIAGFRGGTVPALRLDGRKVQGSLEIARALDEFRPEPGLYPDDPERRRAVEEAERWGERELQPVPRRIFRWSVVNRPALRRWLARQARMPFPDLMATLNIPVARYFAGKAGADETAVQADLAALPRLLDRVEALIADNTIDDEPANAADYQIASSVRVFLSFDDLRAMVERRPAAAELALRIFPEYPGPIPPVLPPEWVPEPKT